MDFAFMTKLDAWRDSISFKVQILEGWNTTGHAKDSYHYKGRAIDGRLIGATLTDHFYIWLRSPFGGAGLYTWGAGGPFFHFDDRPQIYKKTLWVSFVKGEYEAFDRDSMKKLLKLMKEEENKTNA